MRVEPVAVVNGVVTIVEATVALAVGFGLGWDAKQVGLVMAVVVALGNLAKTLWARAQVTPVSDPRNSAGDRLVPQSRAMSENMGPQGSLSLS